MVRGTTPTHTFNVSIDTSKIKEVKIIYSQGDAVVLCKRTKDCTLSDGKIETKLSQEETFMFDCTKNVYIQVRVLTTGGDAINSQLIMTSVAKCLDDEVLV